MKRIFSILFALVLAVSLMLVPAASVGASPGPGIVGLWHFDEGIGSTAADSSGYGNDGTLSGGKFGNALSFDGSDDYVEIPSNSSIMPTTLTVEAWVQPGKTGARQSIVSKWDGGADASYSLELTAANKFLFYLHNGTTTESITGTTVVTVGTWYHVAGTYDGSQARLYVDGNLEAGPTTLVAPMTNSNVPLRIGASAGPAPYSIHSPFQGAIDEVRISDVARASFVLTTPPSADDDTVGLWHFDGDANDSSGNDNDGTIHGASWVPAGPTWTTGMFGNALSFDGTDDYVQVPDSTSLEPSNITVEAWIKRLGGPGNNKYIVSKHYGSGWNSYALRAYSSGLQFYIGTTSTWYGSPMSGPVWDGNWHHVVGTFDGSYVRLYVDGSEVGMGTLVPVGTSIAYDGAGVKFGVPGDPWLSGPYHFGGKIDEVRIWDVALGSTAILQSYELGGAQTSTCVVQLSHQVLTSGEVVCFTSAFHLGRQDPDTTRTVDIYIMSSSGGRTIYDVALRQVTPGNTNGALSNASETTDTHWTAVVTNGAETPKGKTSTSIHLYAELDTLERLGVNAQYLP